MAAVWCHWSPEAAVPFDMLGKYLEKAVRNFYVDGAWISGRRGSSGRTGRDALLAQDGSADSSRMQQAFLQAVINSEAVSAFIEEYAGGSHLSKFR